MTAASQYFLGDLRSARHHLERFLTEYESPSNRSHIIRFQFDPRVPVRVLLAWILWLQGFPDQGRDAAEASVEEARAANHVGSICYALALGASPLALLIGDLNSAEHYMNMLLDDSTRHSLALWRALGRGQRGVFAIMRGDNMSGLALWRSSLDEVGDAGSPADNYLLGMVGSAFGQTGRVDKELAEIDAVIDRSRQTEEGWLIAELLRIKGKLLLLQGASGAARSGRAAVPASARLGAPAGGSVLGTARRYEPSSAAMRSEPFRRGPGASPSGLRPVHRRVRDGRESREGSSRRSAHVRRSSVLRGGCPRLDPRFGGGPPAEV